MSRDVPLGATALLALFVTALVTSQLTAAKLLGFQLPFSIPVAGAQLILPGAAVAYALTYFASDCYAELYGKIAAQRMVNVAFFMNFVMLALVYSTVVAPAAPINAVPSSAYESVLLQSANIVGASLLAYLVSQNWDVVVFHAIRDVTGKDKLWLRNIGSTATSQILDTVLFVGVAFYVLPRAGLNPQLGLPLSAIAALMVGQYLLKLTVAVVDTPFVYLVTNLVRSSESGHADPIVSD
ncbi:queuosine precursor transporter [Halorarius litoreus]|uniref:queuosine precursor transporter n=1 Tax=Halorarius litoreus TaxID=2962676 RepID=UPI0020CD5E2B|nr:queuosine precursor transporter [Halorarius litoreus]